MGDDPTLDPVGRVVDEFSGRYRQGQRPSVTEYTERYPELADRLRHVLPMVAMMEEAGSGTTVRLDGELDSCEETPRRLGGYRLVREIGRGGMGIVYEAEQVALGRHVALKVLPMHAAARADGLERFRRESRAAARLHHTNIVPVYEVGEEGDWCYYAMQYIRGQPLDQVLEELRRWQQTPVTDKALHGAVTVATALLLGPRSDASSTIENAPEDSPPYPTTGDTVQMTAAPAILPGPTDSASVTSRPRNYYRSVAHSGIQVAEALEYAHREGVVHRDIKPSNLLLDADGRVWVTDFGLAKTEGATLTGSRDLIGTFRYMAPERFRGWSDPRSDVYSLGLTLYEMLLLRPAYDATDEAHIMQQVLNQNPPRLRKVDPRIPRDLETVVTKAINKEPSSRYQTAGELSADLKRFLEDRPVLARRSGSAERLWRWCKRNRAVASIAATFVAAFWVGLILVISQWQRAERANDTGEQRRREALAAQGDAERNSDRAGRRQRSLAAIVEAAGIHPSHELRDLAISTLALADLRVSKSCNGWNEDTAFVIFDSLLERYARVSDEGVISIRRVADDSAWTADLQGPAAGGRLRFSPDGRYLAAAAGNPVNLKVWDLQAHPPAVALTTGIRLTTAFDFAPDSRQIVVANNDSSLSIYDLAAGASSRLAPGYSVKRLEVSRDGTRVAVVSHDQQAVEVRDLATGEVISRLSHPKSRHIEMHQTCWHPTNLDLLATTGWGVRLWDVSTGEELAFFQDRAGPTTHISFSPCGNVFVTKGWGDTTVRLRDAWTGQLLVQIPGASAHGGISLQFDQHGKRLAFTLDGHRIKIWEVVLPNEYRALSGRLAKLGRGEFADIDVSPSAPIVAAALRYGLRDGIVLWNLDTGHELAALEIGSCNTVLFHPAGRALLTGGDAGFYWWPVGELKATNERILRIGPPRQLLEAAHANDTIITSSLSRNGGRMAVGNFAGRGTILNLPSNTTRSPRPLPQGPWAEFVDRTMGRITALGDHVALAHVTVSPDGRWIASGTHNGRHVKIWDGHTGQQLHEIPTLGSATVAFSPNGQWLVTCVWKEYCIYKTGSWQCIRKIPRSLAGEEMGPMAFRADSRVLALNTSGLKVQLLDPATGQVFADLEPPDQDRGNPRLLRFSTDGNRLIVCTSYLRILHAWDLRLMGDRLRDLGLPWELPTMATDRSIEAPARVEVDLGELGGWESRRRSASYLAEKDWANALHEANQAIDENRHEAEGYFLRGRAFYGRGDYPKAGDDFSRALLRDTELTEAYHYRGHAHYEQRNFHLAVDDFSEALRRNATDAAHLYRFRGLANYYLREYGFAAADWQHVLHLNARPADQQGATETLAWLYVTGPPTYRDPGRALALLQHQGDDEQVTARTLTTLGAAHYWLGDYDIALQTLSRVAEKQQPAAYELFFLAMTHHQMGHTAKAQECFDQAMVWCERAQQLSDVYTEVLDTLRSEAEKLLATTVR